MTQLAFSSMYLYTELWLCNGESVDGLVVVDSCWLRWPASPKRRLDSKNEERGHSWMQLNIADLAYEMPREPVDWRHRKLHSA